MQTKQCKIRLLDEVFAVVVGLADHHLESLSNRFAVQAPNYFFNPRFKLGQWDGKIRYFQKTGRTYVYLLDEIIPLLVQYGYQLQLEDLRPPTKVPEPIDANLFAHVLHPDDQQPIILRDYQYKNVNLLTEHGNGLFIASTGAGKTLTSAALCHAYGQLGIKTLTIVPNQDLITNTKKDFINCGLDTGEYSGASKDLSHQHIVSTWQALQKNAKIVELFGMVLVDECHGAKGPSLQKILTEHAGKIPYRFGITGTLPKDASDAMTIKVALGPVRATVTASELQDRGILAQLHIDVVQLEEDLSKEYARFCKEDLPGSKPPTLTQFKDGYFPDFASEKAYLHKNVPRVEWIADFLLAKQDAKKGNTLCLVDSITFGRQLAAIIPGAIFVNGQDVKKSSERQKIYDMFNERDDLIVIATVHIAGTGLNIRRIFNLVTVDVGKSFIRVIQAIGRGLRIAKDKDSVIVTDICSDLKYSKKHLKQRTNYYDEAKYKYKKHKIKYSSGVLVDFTDDDV
jgi:superfamily II DNA or RNA helicase